MYLFERYKIMIVYGAANKLHGDWGEGGGYLLTTIIAVKLLILLLARSSFVERPMALHKSRP